MKHDVLTTERENQIVGLFRSGHDTCDIARSLWIPEHIIANAMPRLLERDRQDRSWEGAA